MVYRRAETFRKMENREKNIEKRGINWSILFPLYFMFPIKMKRLGYMFLLFFITSCTSKTIYKKPENLIEKEKMIQIWTDIYIARGARTIKTKDLRKNINYLPLVFEKYDIDSARLSESNLYYTSKIDDYQKMFEEVQRRLVEQKDIYQPQSELDSINERSRAEMELE